MRKLTQGNNLADIEEEPSLLQSRINQFTGRGTTDGTSNVGLKFDPGSMSKRTKAVAVTDRIEEVVAQKKSSFSWDKLNDNLKKRLVAYVGKKNEKGKISRLNSFVEGGPIPGRAPTIDRFNDSPAPGTGEMYISNVMGIELP
jgi:hypothetical protein